MTPLETLTFRGDLYVVERVLHGRLMLRLIPPGVRGLRVRTGLSQGAMARKLGIGQGTLSRYEAGLAEMPTKLLHRLERWAGVAAETKGG